MTNQHTHDDTSATDPNPGRRCCLVTGGAGFIGSHLVEVLLARGDFVTVIDNLSTGSLDNLPNHPNLTFIHANLDSAINALADARKSFDEIYHLAAAVGVQLVLDCPIEAIHTNIHDTASLLTYASSLTPLPRVFIASSSEVYGKGTSCPFAEEDEVIYGPTTVSRWSYGMSKAIDEHLALAHHARSGLPVVVARFFNTVGPRQTGRYGMVLPRFVEAARHNQPLIVYGSGQQSRCFCDVRDVSRTLPMLLAAPHCAGRIFNLGSDHEITINDLALLVISTLNATSPIEHQPYEKVYGNGFEDLARRQPDLSRIRQAINFKPTIPLGQTIADIAHSMQDHDNASNATPTITTTASSATHAQDGAGS